MAVSSKYDLTIIGAGPGGYVAAIRAAQLGMKVALVEKRDQLGGTCLNIGCIPSKALLDSSEQYWKTQHELAAHGINFEGVTLDLSVLMARKLGVVEKLTGGVAGLMKKHGVEVFTGAGLIEKPGVVSVKGREKKTLESKNIILATGSKPQELPFLPFDGKAILSSTDALSLDAVPGKLIVVGAGAIGLELGSVWSRLGSEVVFVEIMETVLPGWDLQVCRALKRELSKQGMEFHLSTKVTGFENRKGGVKIEATNNDNKTLSLSGDKVLVSVGRSPAVGKDIENLGIAMDGAKIKVNDLFETSIAGIFAIGDVVAGPMLAHKAEDEGIACVERLAGIAGSVNYEVIPNVVYTWPEVASVGSSEEELKQNDIPYRKGSFPFRANGRAIAAGDAEGFVKILAEVESDRVLGAHIFGPWASSLIAEIVVVMEFGGSAEDVARTVHAHPTLPEAVKEAALSVDGRSIHGA